MRINMDEAVQETLAFETPETKNIFYEVMKLPERYYMLQKKYH